MLLQSFGHLGKVQQVAATAVTMPYKLFDEAKFKWETTHIELERANRKLEEENSTLVDNNKLTLSQLHDQRAISMSMDRRLTELTAESMTTESTAAFDKELQQLNARLMKLSVEYGSLETDLAMRTIERNQLLDREEILQATLDFNADRLSAAEQRLECLTRTNKSLDDKITTLTAHLEEMKREKEKFLKELHQESGESRLFKALTLVDTQRADLHTKTAEMKNKDEIIKSLELKLSETKLDVERLAKLGTKKEECLAYLMSHVTELKDELSDILAGRDNATSEIKELHESITLVQNQCCTLEDKYDMLCEDFEHLSGKREAELLRATLAEEKNKDLELDVTQLKADNAILKSSVMEWETRCEAQCYIMDLLKSELFRRLNN